MLAANDPDRRPTLATNTGKRAVAIMLNLARPARRHRATLARRDEAGYLHLVDRLKDLITTGGAHVYPREVEDLLGTHPGVAMAAVIG